MITIVPDTVAPGAGAAIEIAGAVTSRTVTLTAAEVVAFPAASRAIARSVWIPGVAVVLFHEIEYGAAVSRVPRLAPSSWNCTLATPTLSLALAETDTEPETLAPAAGAVMDTVGGVGSGGGIV